MKKLLFGLIAIVLFSLNGNAQSKSNFEQKSEIKSFIIKTDFKKEVIEYKFNSLEGYTKGADDIIEEFEFSSAELGRAEVCEVTITVTVEVSVGVASISMTGSMTTSCAEAKAAAKRLKAMLIAAANG